jgi:uncharacterized SAM-binding protein YcdF (DUF218 family)
MDVLKQIIPEILAPYSIALIFLLVGLAFLWGTRKQLLGKIFVSSGTVMLLFFSDAALWESVLPPLEGRYEQLEKNAKQPVPAQKSSIKWVVVLAGGYREGEKLPLPDQLGHETLIRLVEGIAVHRQFPDSKLLVSGGSGAGPLPEAEVMANAAQILGVDSNDIVLEADSHDTYEQARLIRPMIGKDPFVLVTSGYHMPRAMALFRRQGLNPIAAPAGLPLSGFDRFALGYLYPRALPLVDAQNNFREYMSMAWLKLRGRI